MTEVKPNIRMSEDGEHTDFIAELSVKYNGKVYSWKVDLGAECDKDTGILPQERFDRFMEYLRLFARHKLHEELNIIHLDDPAKLNPCYACLRY